MHAGLRMQELTSLLPCLLCAAAAAGPHTGHLLLLLCARAVLWLHSRDTGQDDGRRRRRCDVRRAAGRVQPWYGEAGALLQASVWLAATMAASHAGAVQCAHNCAVRSAALTAPCFASQSRAQAAPQLQHFAKGATAGGRLFAVIHRVPAIDAQAPGEEPDSCAGALSLRNVSLRRAWWRNTARRSSRRGSRSSCIRASGCACMHARLLQQAGPLAAAAKAAAADRAMFCRCRLLTQRGRTWW